MQAHTRQRRQQLPRERRQHLRWRRRRQRLLCLQRRLRLWRRQWRHVQRWLWLGRSSLDCSARRGRPLAGVCDCGVVVVSREHLTCGLMCGSPSALVRMGLRGQAASAGSRAASISSKAGGLTQVWGHHSSSSGATSARSGRAGSTGRLLQQLATAVAKLCRERASVFRGCAPSGVPHLLAAKGLTASANTRIRRQASKADWLPGWLF